ncbi:carboxylating nicotinate-nucleotide diphosphorylase [Nesterenkonia xinjiangensis]|uniref:carboxylating nicotinate-nucleotide diphosphorylase n=1 Tax=Nesterenkonia xinjiangensis TaxID=225327 RepID=UPI0015CB03A1|nr:carboxylating nicotinate-nucleotide diphosphorylase [Nesterenkonia xinjiangensis]
MLSPTQIEKVVRLAFEEDVPAGDLTCWAFVPQDAVAEAALVARQPGVLSGAEVFRTAMTALSPEVDVTLHRHDGARFSSGDRLASVRGPARAVLTAERVALNLVQRMTAVATLTARYVDAVAGTGARITDTRKTTPGLRALERHAVRCGGGHNHRFSLSDAVMAKDNHIGLVEDLSAAVAAARARLPHTTHIEVEVDRIDQIEPALAGGADTVMLDNFSAADLRRGVEIIGGRAVVEASGGVHLDTVGEIAATGVDVISVGALTHGVPAVDLGLDLTTQL